MQHGNALYLFCCQGISKMPELYMEIDKIKLENLLDESSSVFWVLDTSENKLEFISKSIEKLLDIRHNDIIKDPLCWINSISIDFLPNLNSSYFEQKHLNKGTLEVPLEMGNGKKKWISIRWSRSGGDPKIITGWVHDVSEEMEMKSHQPMNRYLDDIYKYNTSGLVNITHELKSPINRILGLAKLIEAASVEDKELEDTSKSILRNAGRLLSSINSLLELSKMGMDSELNKYSQIDFSKVVFELIPFYEKLAQERGVQIEFELDDFKLIVLGDKYILAECCKTIIDNAIKFTETGKVTVRSRSVAGVLNNSKKVEFSVEDTGIGMSKEFMNSLYLPFKQESTGYTRTYKGLGIGMTLAKHYVDLHKGNIAVESEKGKGTKVTVTFDQLSSY